MVKKEIVLIDGKFIVKTKEGEKPPELKILGNSFVLHPTGLTIIGKPTKDEYTEAFYKLQYIEGCIHWWYGDLCKAYEGHYGVITEISENSPFEYDTIRKDKYVAERYELTERSHDLSWTHHLIAAPREDRLDWLKKAEEYDWPKRQLEKEIRKVRMLELPPPRQLTFGVIYADPPWEYEFSKSDSRSIEAHYPTMSVEEICELYVPVEEDAILFLWATSPKLEEALRVITAWGFEYRTNMVWVKAKQIEEGIEKQIGMGYYCREQHELLLIARKGNIAMPDPANRPGSVIISPRTEHSKKPEDVYEIIEHMYPNQSKIELFARKARPGWVGWGDEILRE